MFNFSGLCVLPCATAVQLRACGRYLAVRTWGCSRSKLLSPLQWLGTGSYLGRAGKSCFHLVNRSQSCARKYRRSYLQIVGSCMLKPQQQLAQVVQSETHVQSVCLNVKQTRAQRCWVLDVLGVTSVDAGRCLQSWWHLNENKRHLLFDKMHRSLLFIYLEWAWCSWQSNLM